LKKRNESKELGGIIMVKLKLRKKTSVGLFLWKDPWNGFSLGMKSQTWRLEIL
jgi:hypothetical protein